MGEEIIYKVWGETFTQSMNNMENHVANLSVERRFYKEKTKATHNKQDKPTKKKREK